MPYKIKSVEAEMIIERVHELMAESKLSSSNSWTLSDIAGTVEREFGLQQAEVARSYIIDNFFKFFEYSGGESNT